MQVRFTSRGLLAGDDAPEGLFRAQARSVPEIFDHLRPYSAQSDFAVGSPLQWQLFFDGEFSRSEYGVVRGLNSAYAASTRLTGPYYPS
jgi:hypothetical protein